MGKTKILGSGSFCNVYAGITRFEEKEHKTQVAIKHKHGRFIIAKYWNALFFDSLEFSLAYEANILLVLKGTS